MKPHHTIIIFIILALISWNLFLEFSLGNYIFLVPLLFAVQIFLNDTLESYLVRNLNTGYFSMVIAPGTIIHEMSHAFAAKITGCDIKRISFFNPGQKGGVLGFVEYMQPMDRFQVIRNLLIGFAPFFGCGIFLITIFNYLAGQNPDIGVMSPDLVEIGGGLGGSGGILSTMAAITGKFYEQLIFLDLANPIILLILYLEFSLSLGAAPSSKDFEDFFRSAVRYKLQTLGIIISLVVIILLVEHVPTEYGISYLITLAFKWIVLILMVSLALLLISIPVAYITTNTLEIRGMKKIIPPIAFILAYFSMTKILNLPGEISLISSGVFFIASLFVLRRLGIFMKRG